MEIPKGCANKIKKWLSTAVELQQDDFLFALPITRLTSIKSLCNSTEAARVFALHLAKQVQSQMEANESPEFEPEEWQSHLALVSEAIAAIEINAISGEIKELLQRIEGYQGDDVRRIKWTTVHWVRSGDLLKIKYALNCCIESDYPYWAYKLARQFAEGYEPSSGSGLIPKSTPMLLDIAEFWCRYYFGVSLPEKFPKLMQLLAGVSENNSNREN